MAESAFYKMLNLSLYALQAVKIIKLVEICSFLEGSLKWQIISSITLLLRTPVVEIGDVNINAFPHGRRFQCVKYLFNFTKFSNFDSYFMIYFRHVCTYFNAFPGMSSLEKCKA